MLFFSFVGRYRAARAAAKRRAAVVVDIAKAQGQLSSAYANLKNIQLFMTSEPYPGDDVRLRELQRECFAIAIKIISLSQELGK